MKPLGKVYQSVRGYEIADFEWACGWPLVFKSEDMATQALESMQIGASILITQETAPLHAEIERLKAENAKIRKFVQDVGDLVMALPKDAPLALKYEGDSILLNSFREQAGELIAEWEENEADNA